MLPTDCSPPVRARLVRVPERPNLWALGPTPAPREIDVRGLLRPLERATAALEAIANAARSLPNPDLITRTLDRREAVQSSQIEGTKAELDQLFAYEATGDQDGLPPDVAVTLNYVKALDLGLAEVRQTDGRTRLNLELVRKLHQALVEGTDYRDVPGEFRTRQNFIGGYKLENAKVVPPPVPYLPGCLRDLEDFLHQDLDGPLALPLALRMAIAHVQFEAIHPFPDGNGRVGRLLPPLMMAAEGYPPLYMAGFMKAHQQAYYDALAAVQLREEWGHWLEFFLDGIVDAADVSAATAAELLAVRRRWDSLTSGLRADAAARKLLDVVLASPVLTVTAARDVLGLTFQTANVAVTALQELGILSEMSGRRRDRTYSALDVIAVLEGRPAPTLHEANPARRRSPRP